MDLNLLPSQAKFQMDRIRLKKKITLFMTVAVSVWLLSVVLTLTYKFLLSTKYNQNKKKYDSLVLSYSALAEKMVTSKKLKYQAKKVGEVLSSRFEYAKTMRLANDFFSDEIEIKTFDLTDNKSFMISGTTRSETGVDEIERKIVEINQGQVENFSKAILGSIGVKNSIWEFSMEVFIK